MEQRSPEWFKARGGRVTGSAVGAILGLSPFSTREDVMKRMVRDYHGLPNPFTGNVATDWGTMNEDGARAQFELVHGKTVEDCSFYTHEDWLGASPDGLVGDSSLIEIKCPYGLRKAEKPIFKSIRMMPHYFAQMQIQLFVTNRDDCYFYQWCPNGDDLEIVKRDDAYLNRIMPVLKMFHEQYLHEREHNAKRYF